MPSKREPQQIRAVFKGVLLNRMGINVSEKPLLQDEMERDLERALRLSGHSGDALAISGAIAGDQGERWSDDAEELHAMVEKLGCMNPNLSSEAFIKPFFRHLSLPQLAISELDDDVVKFNRLTFLDVSRNNLVAIDNLPPNLRFLKAYNNQICRVSCKPCASLCFLGLGHTSMNGASLDQAAKRFKHLLSLDLSYSHLLSLDNFLSQGPGVSSLSLQKLKHLSLSGSPVCMLPHYRLTTLVRLPQLQVLDGVPVSEGELADAQLLGAELPATSEDVRMRVSVCPFILSGLRQLLEAEFLPPVAEVVADKEVAKKEGEEAAQISAPPDPSASPDAAAADARDVIAETCMGGALRLHFELPSGDWLETAEIPVGGGAEEGGTATPDNPEGASGGPLESLDLSELTTPDGTPIAFYLRIAENQDVKVARSNVKDRSSKERVGSGDPEGRSSREAATSEKKSTTSYVSGNTDRRSTSGEEAEENPQQNLSKLCQWLRYGMRVKVFFRKPLPPPTPDVDAEAAGEAAAPAKGDKKGASVTPSPAPSPGGEDEEDRAVTRELPPEVPIGGAVFSLNDLLWRTDSGITEDIRQARTLPNPPCPMKHEVPALRIRPMSRWLDPDVQVPLAQKSSQAANEGPMASLRIALTLWDPEPEVPEEEAAET